MSKRTQSIRNMFSAQSDGISKPESAARPTLPRATSSAVRSLKDTFSDVERDYEALREKLASGQTAVELDPSIIDPSPLADRFQEQDVAAFEALKVSMRERGQEIPVLVREHPTVTGRYQSAYGHRRIRAARELGTQVKAYVRVLNDQDLVVAQGLENSAREDLTFIERAVFANRLEDAGFQRALIQAALSVDRAEVSKLITVARSLPGDLVDAIGRAPKVGRGRWQALAEAIKDKRALERAQHVAAQPDFSGRKTDDRFIAALSAAVKSEIGNQVQAPQRIESRAGQEIGRVSASENQWRLSINKEKNEGFVEFLTKRLPELFDDYEASRSDHENG